MHNRSWLLLSKKISGIASDSELAELEEYLLENPEWLPVTDMVTRVWERNDQQRASEEQFAAHINRMEKLGQDTAIFDRQGTLWQQPVKNGRKHWVRIALLAASVVIAFACWFVFQQGRLAVSAERLASAKKVVETESGHRNKIVLPDGTQVWLNAESKLEYNNEYGKTNRDVALSGEAFFDVTKNVKMPFTIQTNKIHIKVTGTAFNVKAYPGDKTSETSLIRGRVEVTINARPDERFVLKPNEKLVVRNEEVVKPSAPANVPDKKAPPEPLIQLGYINFLENDSTAIETSWLYDRLVFDDESLQDISQKLERWYGVHIAIAEPRIATQRLTYTIKKETIEEALDNMRYALRFNYTKDGNNIVITR